jgi:putative sigma-54 modulation protein
VLTVNRGRPGEKAAEVILTVYRQTLSASDIGPTHEKALDKCIEGLRRQLLKYKAKLRSKAQDYHR